MALANYRAPWVDRIDVPTAVSSPAAIEPSTPSCSCAWRAHPSAPRSTGWTTVTSPAPKPAFAAASSSGHRRVVARLTTRWRGRPRIPRRLTLGNDSSTPALRLD